MFVGLKSVTFADEEDVDCKISELFRVKSEPI